VKQIVLVCCMLASSQVFAFRNGPSEFAVGTPVTVQCQLVGGSYSAQEITLYSNVNKTGGVNWPKPQNGYDFAFMGREAIGRRTLLAYKTGTVRESYGMWSAMFDCALSVNL
jgi:hypothetical protein